MIDVIFKVYLIITFGYIKDVFIECNEDTRVSQEHGRDDVSLNSESVEVLNISSKENQIFESAESIELETEILPTHMETQATEEVKKKVTKIPPKVAETPKENRLKENPSLKKKSETKYPYSVSVQKKSSHYTSGALVDKQWVLTSGREFYNVRESIKLYRARLGTANCKKGGIVIPIKQVEVHPSYVQNRPAFDVALLRLGMPVEFGRSVAPIAITQSRGNVLVGKFSATYWPRLIIKGELLPASAEERILYNNMRVSSQTLIPWDECRKLLDHNNVTLEPSSQCLESIKSHHSPCMPDPGAPVFFKDGLWGITSGWTPKHCHRSGARSASVTVFTQLSSPRVYSWLQLLLVDV